MRITSKYVSNFCDLFIKKLDKSKFSVTFVAKVSGGTWIKSTYTNPKLAKEVVNLFALGGKSTLIAKSKNYIMTLVYRGEKVCNDNWIDYFNN